MRVLADRFTTELGPMFGAVRENGAVCMLSFLDPERIDAELARQYARIEAAKAKLEWSAKSCAGLRAQVHEYLDGGRREFDWALDPRGTPFQQEVWKELRRIPYGSSLSYKELAARVGRPRAVRAVGHANGANPISLAIPCHRVLGSDGSLTGYAGGVNVKRALLDLEASAPSAARGRRRPASRGRRSGT